MKQFKFDKCKLDDVKLVYPFYIEDNRGYFLKNYEKEVFSANGIETSVFETFESFSKYGVIRGLHFQTHNPQSKLVRCIRGEIWDVVVDLRKESKTKGEWQAFYLKDEDNVSLFIPPGFAHGFLSLTEGSIISYICSGQYSKVTDTGILWNDNTLKIEWPIDNEQVILSERDCKLQTYDQFLNETKGGLL